ncbi:MAG: ribosome small subunit-dependent GTPase A [Clostridia bacterium]|nr:ribosome small subunit-dependent GTPase A [Clostridia bacterium]
MMLKDGFIIKGIGGFYYVETAEGIFECKARGIFRKSGLKPLAGDKVTVSINDKAENTIEKIHERKNSLDRPPVANVDKLFILSSVCEPKPVLLIVDRLTAIATVKNIEPIVVFTKNDLEDASEYIDIYKKAGIKAYAVSCVNREGIDEIKNELKGCISAFCGNSGVGKSSLLNAIDETLSLKTGEISDKLGRGRHTTRHSEMIKVADGYVADTPGFSSFDIDENELILKDDLPYSFKEFEQFIGQCKFTSCLHMKDKGCRILKAVEEGDISASRHESYCVMMEEAKNIKEWEIRKK